MVVTQNVDNLHERAGSPRVIHMHGELLKARCLACAAHHVWREDITVETPCPGCGEAGRLRSAVVWLNERPLHLPEIIEALRRCRLFIAIGTSGSVYPAAGFVDLVPGHSIELNLAPSAVAS
ncbi:MAG TPA: Sir2 family NAD-dependent protein deacetylase, partial [Dongiaceae bacterium]